MAVFAIGVVSAWYAADRTAMAHARQTLLRGIKEAVEDVMSSPDVPLYYVGSAITRHYRTPEELSKVSVAEIMSRYHIDELNVVDGKGVVICGTLAKPGFDFNSTEKTREYLDLLDGVDTMSQPFRAAVEDVSIVRKYIGVAFPDHDGFVQIGFDQRRMASDIDYCLRELSLDWTVGDNGFLIISRRSTGEIVSCGSQQWSGPISGAKAETLVSVGIDVFNIPKRPLEVFETVIYGEKHLCVCDSAGEYHRVFAAIPMSDVRNERKREVIIVAAVLFVVLTVAVLIALWLSSLIYKLKLEKIAKAKAEARELNTAKTIQMSSLPTEFPEGRAYKVFASMKTAKEVGGDFFDFYELPSGKYLFLIADVSDKGVPAAMFMMRAKAMIRSAVMQGEDLAAAISEANDRLAEHNQADMFVTAWFGIFDEKTGTLLYVNAGHNPPLVKRADGSVEWLRNRPSLVLAAMSGVKYREERLTLHPGDSVFLYTDGVTEAQNAAGDFYGESRLEATLKKCGRAFVSGISEDLAAFVAGAEQSDDITMLAFDFLNYQEN